MNDNIIVSNGVNGSTGDYGLPPMPLAKMAEFIEGQAAPEDLADLKTWYNQHKAEHFGFTGNPKDLSQTGWGIIFAHDDRDHVAALKAALKPLLDLRQSQAEDNFHIFEGADAYRPGETKLKFLARHGKGPEVVKPGEKVPYYVMIVASPEKISYQFQYQLDVQYGVGRLYFEKADGSPDFQAYENYARSVVAAETGAVKLPRQATFFGTMNANDQATELSATYLIQPLYDLFKGKKSFGKEHNEDTDLSNNWQYNLFAKEQATKANLKELLGGAQTPAMLFTATHGMEFSQDDPRQLPHQGALMCQDWPGPEKHKGKISQDFYFAGDDLSHDAQLLGSVVFCFACYGAGTPLYDDFARQAFKKREAITPRPFVAQLPSRLLSHPNGGALAVIGHVERAWPYSFLWSGQGKNKLIQQTGTFENLLERLFKNYPIGFATERFNERYGELATELTSVLDDLEFGAQFSPQDVVGLWTAHNDARDYIVLGDPAIRLAVAQTGENSTRPMLDTVTVSATVVTPAPTPTEAKVDSSSVDENKGALKHAFSVAEKSPIARINDADWAKTPDKVKQLLQELASLLK